MPRLRRPTRSPSQNTSTMRKRSRSRSRSRGRRSPRRRSPIRFPRSSKSKSKSGQTENTNNSNNRSGRASTAASDSRQARLNARQRRQDFNDADERRLSSERRRDDSRFRNPSPPRSRNPSGPRPSASESTAGRTYTQAFQPNASHTKSMTLYQVQDGAPPRGSMDMKPLLHGGGGARACFNHAAASMLSGGGGSNCQAVVPMREDTKYDQASGTWCHGNSSSNSSFGNNNQLALIGPNVDARLILLARKREKQNAIPEVLNETIQDYSYPQTVRELQMSRQLMQGGVNGDMATSGVTDTLTERNFVVQNRTRVRGDEDDKDKFRRYMANRVITANDFGKCECEGRGTKIWIRLCGCGCKCTRCRSNIRYKKFEDPEVDEGDPFMST